MREFRNFMDSYYQPNVRILYFGGKRMKDGTKSLNSSQLHQMETEPSDRAMRIGRTKPYYLIAKEKEIAKTKEKNSEKKVD